ncbi:hypothetical protein PAXRUDRAFT_28531 [Paxillus rubicundulus Ve08.2h10]|uniref:Uncharacterized protein n=1 Tax=Paxillus rubicundulus Ve08.2h10 TaxID=930991 RepID=A0A0D0C6X1_9AGAM|nr:hypothetical protein PAXRUDRAFT_28531 [Paxillus rubicundulus Ve08.2h10]
MATVEVLPHHTHEKNTTQCPGIIDISPKGKRHTSTQKQADDKRAAEMMQMMQKEGVTTKAKPVRPHPRVIKKNGVIDKFAPPSAGTEGKLTGVETEEIEEGTAAAEEDPDVIITKPKKSLKTTLLSTLFFINTIGNVSPDTKNTLIGRINNWAADTGKSGGAPQALHGSAGVSATLYPPSTLSRLSGSTKATSVQNTVQIVSTNKDTRMDIQERSSLTQNLKRKEPEPDYVSTSEVEFSEEEIAGDAESIMDIEEPGYMAMQDLEPGVSHKVQTTMETSVTILAMPSHSVKKAKVEPCIKSEQLPLPSENTPSTALVGSSCSIAGGANGGHYSNTDLPLDFLKDKKWWKVVISTPSLWATNLPDTFSILKNQIADALKFILPAAYPEHPNIVQTLKLDASSPIVAVAYQHLCEWHSGIGSTAVALLINFFAGSAPHDVHSTMGLLLDRLVFLYEDLD